MLAKFEITSDFIESPRKIWVQGESPGTASDCLIFLDAEFYIDKVCAPAIIDDLVRSGKLSSVTAVYVSHMDVMTRVKDLTCSQNFNHFLMIDLINWIRQMLGRFERLFLCGLSLSGLAAVFAMLQNPNAFFGVLSQSPSAWWNDEWLTRASTDQRSESRVWISVGDQEVEENVLHSPAGLFQTASQRDSVYRLAEAIRERSGALHYEEFSGGHDMACWATELPRALSWLTR